VPLKMRDEVLEFKTLPAIEFRMQRRSTSLLASAVCAVVLRDFEITSYGKQYWRLEVDSGDSPGAPPPMIPTPLRSNLVLSDKKFVPHGPGLRIHGHGRYKPSNDQDLFLF